MHPGSLVRRRPSASLVISVIALFVALGGVGYAAGFIGTSQLENGAVTNWKIANGAVGNWKLAFGAVGARKIENGAVGKHQINPNQVQARVAGTCANGGQAVTGIGSSGTVSCGATAPKQFGAATSSPVTIDPAHSSTQIASETLPSGSPYLLIASANATITGSASGQWVKVSCTLSPGGSAAAQTNTASVHVSSDPESVTIPLTVPAPSSATNSTASLSCAQSHGTGSAPTVTVAGSINALQTASNS